jgi:transcriptional regulator with XRE-family HTH domain
MERIRTAEMKRIRTAEIASQIGMTPQAVNNWLSGRRAPGLVAQARLRAAGILLPPRPPHRPRVVERDRPEPP